MRWQQLALMLASMLALLSGFPPVCFGRPEEEQRLRYNHLYLLELFSHTRAGICTRIRSGMRCHLFSISLFMSRSRVLGERLGGHGI